jgi:hypothetical protein
VPYEKLAWPSGAFATVFSSGLSLLLRLHKTDSSPSEMRNFALTVGNARLRLCELVWRAASQEILGPKLPEQVSPEVEIRHAKLLADYNPEG